MTINIKEIIDVMNIAQNRMASMGIDEITIKTDHYLVITADDWDPMNDNIKPVVGSLKEDWDFLRITLDKGYMHTFSDLDRIASLLRAISETMAPTTED